ncbi:MAG TPA: HypC/HybG/HupF family hydrogenase formation chaperone [Azospirillaceae bacterium]|nr:HypC/HybG/HupF family hydrogenase formation chaperone [Azospirillaceae bacterium]
MCVGIPMRIVQSHGMSAVTEGRGVRREVSLMLTGDLPVGTLVLVHKDSAVHILTPEDAAATNAALDEVEAIVRGMP